MIVRVKRLCEEAVMPKKAHESDAGFDLVAVRSELDELGNMVYGTGLAFEIPDGYVGLLFPRSSIAKKDLALTNCVGVIDSGYRGEVMAKFKSVVKFSENGVFFNNDVYEAGDRIVQMIIMKLPDVQLVESDELGESDRGKGGFGSSGA